MEFIIGFIFLIAIWLTVLTRETREQKRKNKILEKSNKNYIVNLQSQLEEIVKLKNQLYGRQETEETKKAEKGDGTN